MRLSDARRNQNKEHVKSTVASLSYGAAEPEVVLKDSKFVVVLDAGLPW